MPTTPAQPKRDNLANALITLAGLLSLCFLASCNQDQVTSRQAVAPEELAQQELTRQGRELFNSRCISCHGRQGNGLGARSGPSLQRAEFTYGHSKADILTTLRNGRSGGMPSFAATFTEQQLEALTAYVLYLKK